MAIKLRGEDKVVLTALGEGSTSQGEWYEAVNWAAIHKLPVIFIVENNQYAISERQDKQMAVKSAADKACGLGLPGITVDGTNAFTVYQAVKEAADNARAGNGATLIETRLYRITPHSSDDDDRTYRSREEVEEHKKSDPLLVTQAVLESQGLITPKKIEEFEVQAKAMVEDAVRRATEAPYPDVSEGLHPVYFEEVIHA